MRISILSAGSRGDTQPYVALGVALRQAGHTVTLAASEGFEAFVTGHGLEYAPVTGDFQSDPGRAGGHCGPVGERQPAVAGADAAPHDWSDHGADGARSAGGQPGCRGRDQRAALPGRRRSRGVGRSLLPGQPVPLHSDARIWPPFPAADAARLAERPVVHGGGATGLAGVQARDQSLPARGRSACPDRLAWAFPGRAGRRASDPVRLQPARDPRLRRTGPITFTSPATGGWIRRIGRHPPICWPFWRRVRRPSLSASARCPNSDPAATTRLILDALARTGQRAMLHTGWGGIGELGAARALCTRSTSPPMNGCFRAWRP